MKMNLTHLEIRILGSLMEKELATPENYPLSLNSLASSCNQKSNRDPVLNLSEKDLTQGLSGLSGKGLARLTATGGRVARYCHSVTDKLGLSAPARAVLAELMLRGPQTVGELRGRAERMVALVDMAAVEDALLELQQHGPPLVVRLPRQSGRKEQRYAQVMSGPLELQELLDQEEAPPAEPSPRRQRPPGDDRVMNLDAEISSLRSEVAQLRQTVQQVISSFR